MTRGHDRVPWLGLVPGGSWELFSEEALRCACGSLESSCASVFISNMREVLATDARNAAGVARIGVAAVVATACRCAKQKWQASQPDSART